MLQNFHAQDRVERGIGLRNRRDVADDIEPGLVPRARGQSTPIPRAVVLREVLGYISKVGAVFLELKLPCACVEDALAFRDITERLDDPCDSVCHMMRADGSDSEQLFRRLSNAAPLYCVGTWHVLAAEKVVVPGTRVHVGVQNSNPTLRGRVRVVSCPPPTISKDTQS